MPHISRTIADLTPNTFDLNNPSTQSTWFSHVRTVYATQHGGIILPPTKEMFMCEWNIYDINNFHTYGGPNLESCKEYLKNYYHFLSFSISPRRTRIENIIKIKVVTWTRMILAFNLYAEFRRAINLSPYNKVDFIGSKRGDINSTDFWEPHFHGRCVLFISNGKLQHMMYLTESNRTYDFWQCIFDIYDAQRFDARFQYTESENNIIISNIFEEQVTTEQIPIVDNQNYQIAQEYLNNINEEETDVNNQQIANMIMNYESSLPSELRKTIFEYCLAFHISHPI